MLLSNLQVLEAVDEGVLQVIISEIEKRTDVEFYVRDFVLRAPSLVDALSSNSSSGTRRMLQTNVGQNYTLNDPAINTTWWFHKINVTGAWRLLGLNNSDLRQQTSDVIVAVTDSGALVNHTDLVGSWWENPDELDGDLSDNDNNTFIDDVYGACFSTRQCSPTYLGNNVSRCGIGRDTISWNGITDRVSHGTKIAGLIGANPNDGVGIAGVAPNLRQMILKVTDESFDPFNPPYAYSDVVRAVDYGYGKGARIFSMSFGNDARNSMTQFNKPSLDAAASAYRTLFRKYNNALFVAAAGNEWTSLENWRGANYTYSPCMVDTPNTLCVGGTNSEDKIFYLFAGNRDQGTNYGATTVDMGAPGAAIWTTDIAWNGYYNNVYGTSFSAPITAAVAGLVLAALGGQGRATSATPLQIKNILMTTGDDLPSLQGMYRSSRRINAGNAVAAALTLARTNRTTVRMARTIESVNSTVAMQAWEFTWYSGVQNDGSFDPIASAWNLFDVTVRNEARSDFRAWRYQSNALGVATALMRVDTPGFYSIQARTRDFALTQWQLTVGEVVINTWNVLNATTATIDLIFPQRGYYNITLRTYTNPTGIVSLWWTTPSSGTWAQPTIFWTIHEDGPSTRHYDPNPAPKPALWHVVWNESSVFTDFQFNRGYFMANSQPRQFRDWQTTVADFSFPTGTDLRNALYGTGGAPSNNRTVVYGYARANLRAMNFSTGLSFRLQGPHTRLLIDGQNIFDFMSVQQLQTVTPCVNLRSGVTHEIFLFFAARVNSSNPVGITWAPCTGTAVSGGNSGAYSSFSSNLATNFFYAPTSTTGLPRGFRCDAWPGSQSIITVGTTPPLGTPPTLTWMYPRDCPNSIKVGSECKMATRMGELFPSITWPVWHVRCYTYWSGSLSNGTSRALNLIGAAFQHQAGVRIYDQPGDGISFTNFAPYRTRFAANVYQLYVIEWVAYGQLWNLVAQQTIWDGTFDTSKATAVLTTNPNTMILPPASLGAFRWSNPTTA
ncbi:hypothetical protein HYH03_017230 [Edaphochlamys debaryana]|uniref:Peptidase S8/S53 domain-containing protein n=1 Tax=Edaphochlamys debaryana TaxID=47281 RepID=A0A836BQM0_9CHLO|nr:hypothetical protein HYH03_017230 [Edaphochlamys debaryana]|eukprot:KAG2483909.1 hypothetical protein HYH03_017230 [Edaphochlamys debaryana]